MATSVARVLKHPCVLVACLGLGLGLGLGLHYQHRQGAEAPLRSDM